MAQIIAETYEILDKIGSGGGGDVYLAKHLRLDKFVVLKADKRTASAGAAHLRREVDALKNLSHQYIPQVYDFFAENEVVYTVMDYIEGESFDKPLRRGKHFTQAEIIGYAAQLLEALSYLHSRPTPKGVGIVHSDIKPANIMLTPQGDIRLIDFNIALALGADAAIAGTPGYASPEHYGFDFSSGSTGATVTAETAADGETVLLDASSTPSSRKKVVPDVRSDIYSLGAALYHMLSGIKPARNAKEVIPLSEKQFSAPITGIINKSMNPNPDLRYQSADEMLYAFTHIREADPRAKRHKRVRNAAAAVCAALFALGTLSAFTGLKRMQSGQRALTLAEYSANALTAGDSEKAIRYALDALPEPGVFTPPYAPQAQSALAAALGVYDLADGFKAHRVIELPSEILKIAISPNGRTGAAVTPGTLTVFDTETADVIAELPTVDSALADMEFIDDTKLMFAGREGVCLYDFARRKEIWTGKPATEIAAAANGSFFAAVHKDDDSATVYDANGNVLANVDFAGKKQRAAVNDSFANPNDNLFALSADGEKLAVSFENGALSIFDVYDHDGAVEIYDESGFYHFEGGFSGNFFAFSATGAEGSVFAVIDLENLAQTGGFESSLPFHVLANERGVYLSNEDVVVKIDPRSGEQTEIAYTPYDVVAFDVSAGAAVVSTTDNAISFFDGSARLIGAAGLGARGDFVKIAVDYALAGGGNSPVIRVLKRERNPVFAVYDADYAHDEARVSADGERLTLFAYDGFRICGADGKLYNETEIPNAKQVYDQQYRREGSASYLEVIYNDGRVDRYSGTTGELLETGQRAPPDLSLREEFFTDKFRIEAPLHGAPAAYDKTTGKHLRDLEKDAYLAYVTEPGGHIVTEYVTTSGERYALLLNENLEMLAKLPQLTDIVGDTLYFDDQIGNIRQGRIYSADELIALAKTRAPP